MWQLERQSGRTARQRGKQLHKRTRGYGVWLTAMFANFEWVVMLSMIALFDMLIPAASRQDYSVFTLLRSGISDVPEQLSLLFCAAYILTVALSEPFYVACGFTLYLNRRALLEGWDIEMQMRRLAETKRVWVSAIVLLVVLACSLRSSASSEACQKNM